MRRTLLPFACFVLPAGIPRSAELQPLQHPEHPEQGQHQPHSGMMPRGGHLWVNCTPALITWQSFAACCRNVTVTGTAASRASIDTMPVLDLQNKVGVLQLCSSCTFMFMYVSIANENRAGTGGGISAFKGQPGSRVEWLEGIGLRPACAPTSSALALLNNTQRSALFPSPPGGGQLVRSTNLTYRVSWLPSQASNVVLPARQSVSMQGCLGWATTLGSACGLGWHADEHP
jgi:hypothetical protein